MKTKILSLLVLALSIALMTLAWDMLNRTQLTSSANEQMMSVTTAALQSWDPDPVLALATETFTGNNGEMYFRTLFQALQRLGALQELKDITVEMEIPRVWETDSEPTARYTLQAVFTDGSAEVRIDMRYRADQWLINNYEVLSSLMIARAVNNLRTPAINNLTDTTNATDASMAPSTISRLPVRNTIISLRGIS